jgi:hypothetical protein
MKHVTVETKLRKNNTAIQTLEKTLLCSPSFLELAELSPKHGLAKRLDPPYIMVTTINT